MGGKIKKSMNQTLLTSCYILVIGLHSFLTNTKYSYTTVMKSVCTVNMIKSDTTN